MKVEEIHYWTEWISAPYIRPAGYNRRFLFYTDLDHINHPHIPTLGLHTNQQILAAGPDDEVRLRKVEDLYLVIVSWNRSNWRHIRIEVLERRVIIPKHPDVPAWVNLKDFWSRLWEWDDALYMLEDILMKQGENALMSWAIEEWRKACQVTEE